MRKTKVVLAKVLTAAMVISSFAGVQGITSDYIRGGCQAETIKKERINYGWENKKDYRKEREEV